MKIKITKLNKVFTTTLILIFLLQVVVKIQKALQLVGISHLMAKIIVFKRKLKMNLNQVVQHFNWEVKLF